MANRSTFPNEIDVFAQKFDIPSSMMPSVVRFKQLKEKSSLTSTEQVELDNLIQALNEYLFTPEDWNKFADALINMEIFIKDNVEGYVIQKQSEMQTYVDTKQLEFDAEIQKFSHKGQYSSTTTYQMWNTVTYNYETFISKQNNNLNHTPIGNEGDLWWSKAAARGAQGIPGIGLSFSGEYNNATSYTPGNAVNYNGSIYYCILNSIGNLPTNTTYWTKFMDGTSPIIQDTQPEQVYPGQIWIQTGL